MKGQKWIATSVILLFACLTIVFFLISEEKKHKKEGGLVITYASARGDNYNLSIEYFEKLRNYKVYQLSDSLSNQEILIDFRNRLNEIKKNRDTINGVHLIMGDSTAYSDYIKAINICNEKEPKVYAPYENHIYALYISNSKIDPYTKKLKADSLILE